MVPTGRTVLVRVYLVNIDRSAAGDQIDAMGCRIIEEVVGAGVGGQIGQFLSGVCIENQQTGRCATGDEENLVLFVIGERHIIFGPGQLPGRRLGVAGSVDHQHFGGFGDIHKDPIIRIVDFQGPRDGWPQGDSSTSIWLVVSITAIIAGLAASLPPWPT